MIENFMQDLRYGFRGLRREPMLALAATLTLAICIGANTTVFSLVNSVLLRPLPFPNSERVYALNERMGKNQMEVGIGADYYSLREENRVFDDVAAYDSTTVNWSGADKPEQLNQGQVTPSFFQVLGTQPLTGRYFAREEVGRKAPPIVVLSYAFWRSRMASDPQVTGKTITLDRLPWTVIGVMPQGFDYPNGTQLWRPLDMDESSQRPRSPMRPMRMVNMLARLKPDVTPVQLDTELRRLASAIYAEYPKGFATAGFISGLKVQAMPLQRRVTGDLRPALLVLSFAVGLVLLIACANLANLLLARAAAQQRELAVRMALGSARGRIVRQVLTESLALALPGGLAGVAIATLAITALNARKPLVLENYPAISMDVPTLAFTFGLTLLTGLVFGMAPALAAASVNIQDALKSATQTHSGGRGAARLRHLLVVAELGVSLVLLIGAGLLFKSFVKLSRTELGFTAQNLLTLRVNLARSRYATAANQAHFYDEVLEGVKQLPMVRVAAVSTDLPLSEKHPFQGMAFQVAGRSSLPMAQQPQTNVTVVSRDFFRTLGIPLRSGRTFGVEDTIQSPDNIVVNEAFANKIFPGENALGQRIVTGRNDSTRWTIAGVVGSIRGSELAVDPAPLIYRCNCQSSDPYLSRMRLIVRTTGDPRAAIAAVEGQIYAVDRNQPVFDVRTMEERLADSLAPQRFQLLLIGTFAVIAIVLAAIGVYGVMSYLVTRRTREIGIRVAMGARPQHVLVLVVRESFALAVAGVFVGLGGAWALTRYLTSMLYGVTVLDSAVFATMPMLLAAIAIGAAWAPARRASRIDPMTALRES
ncbi:MAG: ABC transporter permease [Bryobacteraceae bacterium]